MKHLEDAWVWAIDSEKEKSWEKSNCKQSK